MNEVIKAIHERRSIRRYKAEMPSAELIDQVVDAGLWAANGRNLQNSKLIVVKNKQLRDKLSLLNCQVGGYKEGTDPYYGAPIIIMVIDKKGTTHTEKDGCSVLATMMLAAHSLGLGTCWINRAKETFELEEGRAILEELGLEPDCWVGVGSLAIGYPDGEVPKGAPRKPDRVTTVE